MKTIQKYLIILCSLALVVFICAGCGVEDKTYTCQGCGDSYTPSENMTQCKSIAKRNLCTYCYASIEMYID